MAVLLDTLGISILHERGGAPHPLTGETANALRATKSARRSGPDGARDLVVEDEQEAEGFGVVAPGAFGEGVASGDGVVQGVEGGAQVGQLAGVEEVVD